MLPFYNKKTEKVLLFKFVLSTNPDMSEEDIMRLKYEIADICNCFEINVGQITEKEQIVSGAENIIKSIVQEAINGEPSGYVNYGSLFGNADYSVERMDFEKVEQVMKYMRLVEIPENELTHEANTNRGTEQQLDAYRLRSIAKTNNKSICSFGGLFADTTVTDVQKANHIR